MKTKSFFFLLAAFFILLCFSFVGCAGVNELREKSPNEEAGKEILIDRNITANRPFWCGKKNTLVYHKEVGLFIYEVESGKKIKVGDGYQSPLTCTPDGEWLIYMDKSSTRWDTDSYDLGVVDLWRYELKTGKREKFFIVSDDDASSARGAIFAPKGLKLYLSFKPETTMEMPEPKWDVVWLERESVGSVWFKEPMALIGDGSGRYQEGALVIDVLSPYKKKFVMDSGFYGATIIMIDAQERIYMNTVDDNFARGEQTVRCSLDVDKVAISCESIFKDIMAEGHPSFGFDITSDGDFAVTALWKDSCVRLRRRGESGERCITNDDSMVGTKANISPDERWLAFTRLRHIGERNYHSDLYITRFTRD